MKTNPGLVLLVLVGAAVSLPAAPSDAKQPTDFKSLDTDGDGRISLQEFTAPAVARQPKDAAKSGQTPEEKPIPADGILSSADTIEGRYSPEVFRHLDIDHDKFVSPVELEALFSNAHNISQP